MAGKKGLGACVAGAAVATGLAAGGFGAEVAVEAPSAPKLFPFEKNNFDCGFRDGAWPVQLQSPS